MTNPDPADVPRDDRPPTVRTSLTLRREVHDYFTQRAHTLSLERGKRYSVHQMIVSLCEGAFHEWTQMQQQRDRRSNQ